MCLCVSVCVLIEREEGEFLKEFLNMEYDGCG